MSSVPVPPLVPPIVVAKPRILFVDDDVPVLRGLQRILHGRKNEWVTVFAEGGAQAKAALAAEHFDVLVTDMRMPGIDGTALLRHVQEHFPTIARIALTGHTQLDVALDASMVAHQFLTKPCDPSVLSAAIERTAGLRGLVDDDALRGKIGEVGSLPALPKVVGEMNALLARPNATLAQLAEVLMRDPSLTTKILQLVNSPYFGLSRHVDSVAQAVSLLGTRTVRSVATSVSALSVFASAKTLMYLERTQRSAALVAQLAPRLLKSKDLAFLSIEAGLLHDIGIVVLAAYAPDILLASETHARDRGISLARAEEELGTLTHAQVGAYVLGLWGLPPAVVEAVAYHHDAPSLSNGAFAPVDAVYIARHLIEARMLGGEVGDEVDEAAFAAYLGRLGVADSLPAWNATADDIVGRVQ